MADDVDLPSVDAISVGAVGEPGQRVFYVQLWASGRIVSLKVEKQQVTALAAALTELLADLPPIEPEQSPDIVDPGQPDWVVGTMALTTYDETAERAFLVLNELVRADPDEEEPGAFGDPDGGPMGASARLGLTLPQLAGLVLQGEEAVGAGRPACPFCGYPMDPNGHACPKTNGSATR
jgi:uncharacterized repeat protein (TIGR03847 family)